MGKTGITNKFSIANLKRTVYYLRRNGIKNTCYAIGERLSGGRATPYVYIQPSEEEWRGQRARALEGLRRGEYEGVTFSVVVPAYRTDAAYLRDMITSVIKQSYPCWELIIADATENDSVREVVEACKGQAAAAVQDGSGAAPGEAVRYVRLTHNGGISENTNQALTHVSGNYVGLLDHDDLLAPDALYEMAECIRKAGKAGRKPRVLYSDEDKCSGDAAAYFDPHFKEKFNLDLILSNNYICHFMVMDRELIQKLKFRREYEGAQDYDLVLRAVSELEVLRHPGEEALICHIPKVLYHWRCHAASTAENPRSKDYAYEAGRRALQDFADRNGLPAEATHLKHLGFYRLVYRAKTREEEGSGAEWEEAGRMLEVRPDLGAVGGCLARRGKVAGGRMDSAGNTLYLGLPVRFSGYMHRAALPQDAEAVDIRALALRGELRELFAEVAGFPYEAAAGTGCFDAAVLPADTDCRELSLRLCAAIRERGYRIAYLPYLLVG